MHIHLYGVCVEWLGQLTTKPTQSNSQNLKRIVNKQTESHTDRHTDIQPYRPIFKQSMHWIVLNNICYGKKLCAILPIIIIAICFIRSSFWRRTTTSAGQLLCIMHIHTYIYSMQAICCLSCCNHVVWKTLQKYAMPTKTIQKLQKNLEYKI